MWVVLGISIGLAVVLMALIVVLVARRRTKRAGQAPPAISGDELFSLGVVFTGAGVALMISLGPFMAGLMVLGIVYMVMGAQKKKRQTDR